MFPGGSRCNRLWQSPRLCEWLTTGRGLRFQPQTLVGPRVSHNTADLILTGPSGRYRTANELNGCWRLIALLARDLSLVAQHIRVQERHSGEHV